MDQLSSVEARIRDAAVQLTKLLKLGKVSVGDRHPELGTGYCFVRRTRPAPGSRKRGQVDRVELGRGCLDFSPSFVGQFEEFGGVAGLPLFKSVAHWAVVEY